MRAHFFIDNKQSLCMILVTGIVAAFLLLFVPMPFCKINMIVSDYDDPSIQDNDKIMAIEDCIMKYPQTLFLKKGMSFDIITNKGENGNVYFGWYNNIKIKVNKNVQTFKVDKIRLFSGYPHIANDTEEQYWDQQPKDSICQVIEFTSKDNDTIEVFKQPSKLPFGNQSFGFVVASKNMKFTTGRRTMFDY
jgi:hypothetical protein